MRMLTQHIPLQSLHEQLPLCSSGYLNTDSDLHTLFAHTVAHNEPLLTKEERPQPKHTLLEATIASLPMDRWNHA